MLRAVPVLAVLLLALPARADDPEKEKKGPPAADLLADGLAKAKKEDKKVFLIFGSPSCGWCKFFDKYHADAEVEKVVGKYFVLVKVDVVTNPGGEEMYHQYGSDRGVPAWTVLDAAGKTVVDSGDGEDNVGFPYEPNEVEHYIKAVRKGAPKMSDAEAELLTKKLKDIGPKKEK
ncbi:MAG TPA: thioredoxin family protein [Gemmataceae bacterium]|nr:thioredoxin family protein [Gemmataceae bacterium]